MMQSRMIWNIEVRYRLDPDQKAVYIMVRRLMIQVVNIDSSLPADTGMVNQEYVHVLQTFL